MRFEAEDESMTKYLLVGAGLEFTADQHGYISFSVNDTTLFDNKFRKVGGAKDFLPSTSTRRRTRSSPPLARESLELGRPRRLRVLFVRSGAGEGLPLLQVGGVRPESGSELPFGLLRLASAVKYVSPHQALVHDARHPARRDSIRNITAIHRPDLVWSGWMRLT